jgi:hypothetical protein
VPVVLPEAGLPFSGAAGILAGRLSASVEGVITVLSLAQQFRVRRLPK